MTDRLPFESMPTSGIGTSLDREGHSRRAREPVRRRPPFDVATVDDRVAQSVGSERLNTVVAGAFAALALLLAAVGVYSIAAHAAVQRRYELSSRFASQSRPVQKDVWRLTWICPFEPPGTVWIM